MPKIAGPIRQQAERSRGKLLDVSFDHSDTDPHLIIPHSEVGDAAEVLATPMKAAGHVQDGCSLCGRNVVIGLRRSAKLHLTWSISHAKGAESCARRLVQLLFRNATRRLEQLERWHQDGLILICGDGALHPDCRALVLAVLGHHVHEKVSPRQVFLHAKREVGIVFRDGCEDVCRHFHRRAQCHARRIELLRLRIRLEHQSEARHPHATNEGADLLPGLASAKPGDAQAVAAQVIQHCGMEAAVLSRPVPRNLELRCNALGNSDPGIGAR
mmetsp:Transcript_19101/g.72201  ORF Transcript_19101/g.72201 Transcript_19101/m.72201 type:complete len:271 (-) Transcript_19101:410-1222(-)